MTINLSQLDLKALKNYLKIVYGFRTEDDPSGDTVAVDGTPSNFIANASLIKDAEGKDKLQHSRNLVDMAKGLVQFDEEGNIKTLEDGSLDLLDANKLMTDQEGLDFAKNASTTALNVAEDMRVLRNEMYHMKRDMMVTGNLAPTTKVYNGLVDPFKAALPLYKNDTQSIEIVSKDGVVQTKDLGDFTPDQYVLLFNSANDKHPIARQIIDVNNTDIDVGEFFMDYSPDTVDKTYGVYRNGMFFFGKEDNVRDLDAGNSVHAILKDGSERICVGELNLDKNVLGYATTFTVPASLDNTYLRQLDLILAVNGNPGNIHLEIYPYNEAGVYDPNSEQCIMSEELQSGKAFSVFRTYPFLLSKDILLSSNITYVVLIKAKGTSSGNIWKIGGFREACSAEYHQDTYWIGSDGSIAPEYPDASGYLPDAYIGIGAVRSLETKYIPAKAGAYSSSFILEESDATRVRITFNPVKDYNPKDDKKEFPFKLYVRGRKAQDITNLDGINPSENPWRAATLVNGAGVIDHRVYANGMLSGKQLVWDFEFKDATGQVFSVTEIEFQIVFDTEYEVGIDTYEGLMSLVVSTDNGSILNSLR